MPSAMVELLWGLTPGRGRLLNSQDVSGEFHSVPCHQGLASVPAMIRSLSMNRVQVAAVLACGLFWIPSASADDSPTRSRESFNAGWKFARFGPMADGSTRPEPGAGRFAFTASASTEELAKGNVAQHAIDGDPETRWCASGGGLSEWLMLDLGSALPVEAIEVDWEFPELDYAFVVEWSNEGQAWNRLAEAKSRGTAKRVPIAASSALPAHSCDGAAE